jgi:hypothetical protein
MRGTQHMDMGTFFRFCLKDEKSMRLKEKIQYLHGKTKSIKNTQNSGSLYSNYPLLFYILKCIEKVDILKYITREFNLSI